MYLCYLNIDICETISSALNSMKVCARLYIILLLDVCTTGTDLCISTLCIYIQYYKLIVSVIIIVDGLRIKYADICLFYEFKSEKAGLCGNYVKDVN